MREIVDMVIREYGEMPGDRMDMDRDTPYEEYLEYLSDDSLYEEYLEYLSDQSRDIANDDDANDDRVYTSCFACNFLNKEEQDERLCGREEIECQFREKCGHCKLYPDGGGLCEFVNSDQSRDDENDDWWDE